LETFTPYYGDGDKPEILSIEGAGDSIPYNVEFALVVRGDVKEGERGIVMIRYGTCTHSTNMDQRVLRHTIALLIP
jgi:hypothetical protein